MTAKEARAIITSNSKSLIQSCEEKIRQAAYNGKFYTNFPLREDLENDHKRNLIYYLKDNGFKAEIQDTTNQDYEKIGEHIWIRWDLF